MVNEDPAAVHVRADATWADLPALIEDIKANPGKYKASGTGQGGIWHLAIAGLLSELDMDPASVPWVPSEGAAPGLQDLVAGGVDIVPSSIPEAQSLLEAGRVKSLAVMSSERNPAYPTCRPPRKPSARPGTSAPGAASSDRRACRRKRSNARSGAGEGLQQRRIQGLHERPRLRHALGRR
jgi:hypothetical protein